MEKTADEIEVWLEKNHRKGNIILVTGGEPMLQDLTELTPVLYWYGPVHLETNGTQKLIGHFDWVVVSPKGVPLLDGVLERADELKWLVGGEKDIISLKQFLDETDFSKMISVQPISEGKEATVIAVRAAIENGWHLSVQVHKLIGLK